MGFQPETIKAFAMQIEQRENVYEHRRSVGGNISVCVCVTLAGKLTKVCRTEERGAFNHVFYDSICESSPVGWIHEIVCLTAQSL